ncbi:hypothetical protein DIE04_07960 [Burkholderia sp. Bp8994]|nr:hypothetical protein DIE20_16185 [Burkholderia sp. Bp9131]RQR76368.1 hypothetical protein DIE12_07900 [Burkholderia sp. Bp9015]RQR99695.1 hypothetical protein DIE04_07960 [Burkholderia sp. Bp8994]RQS28276.1 hypothetical protein DIE05_15375 [Burkholderia sp. Bp8995]RQS43043.1 hypothetical protein DIE01_07910 [Burkholderia sp. Bp8990]RQS46511.1 hypothetical protein DIE00_16720 [Burkholderia sp. Bp8989]RQS59724.1 hypothetical protein DID98_15295 [Burkholderia sp. Bp8984]
MRAIADSSPPIADRISPASPLIPRSTCAPNGIGQRDGLGAARSGARSTAWPSVPFDRAACRERHAYRRTANTTA